jgi:hypothetical protein
MAGARPIPTCPCRPRGDDRPCRDARAARRGGDRDRLRRGPTLPGCAARRARGPRSSHAGVAMRAVAGRPHDGDDLLNLGRIGGIAETLVSRRSTSVEARHGRRRAASTSAVKQHLGRCPSSGLGTRPSIRRQQPLRERSRSKTGPVRRRADYCRSSNSAASGHWRGRMSLLLQSRSSSLDVRFRCSSQGRSAGVGGRRARSREGGRRVLSRLSPPHRAFIGRVLRDTRRRLHGERLPYAGGVPARGSLPYAASAWRGGQPALGVA